MSEADLKSPRRWTRRPIFSPSQMLTAQQLNALIDDQRAHSEMLMRGLHGHGVIFGFAVTLHDPRPPIPNKYPALSIPGGSPDLEISCGMALDRHGRLLHWPAEALAYGEVVNRPDCAGSYTLLAHYAERRMPKGGCGPCGEQAEWIDEGVVFSLAKGCEPANRDCPSPRGGRCVSLDDYICFRTGSEPGPIPTAPDLKWACMNAGELCRVDCSDISYDPGAGIPIACVELANLAAADCPEEWGFAKVGECCEVRPRVYRTPLLYELIHGCQHNLARVEALSWQDWCVGFGAVDWDYRVAWQDFEAKFGKPDELVLTFTRPIRSSTVHGGSVFLTVLTWDREADYVTTRRVPAKIEPVTAGKFSKKFKIQINPKWMKSEITSRSNLRSSNSGRVELTIRGQMLRDECDNMLDAVPIGYAPATPALNRPGDDFVAVFRFAKAAEPPPQQDDEDEFDGNE